MHAVSEIDIKLAGLAEHRFVAFCETAARVRGLVARAVVGLYFGYHQGYSFPTEAADDKFTQETFGDFKRWPIEKFPFQYMCHKKLKGRARLRFRREPGSRLGRIWSRSAALHAASPRGSGPLESMDRLLPPQLAATLLSIAYCH